jgi:small subunit ribosomal protein S16
MATKLRLQRHGKKGRAFYHIVAVDGRAKRDGKYLERLGTYNPNTNPATIDIDFDKTLNWVKKGAQPTDTVRAMLSYKGILMKNHLDRGVIKGALTQEQADAKFAKWVDEKSGKIGSKKDRLAKAQAESSKARLDAESKTKEARAAKIAAAAKPAEVEEQPVAAAETPAASENNTENTAPAAE